MRVKILALLLLPVPLSIYIYINKSNVKHIDKYMHQNIHTVQRDYNKLDTIKK